MKKILFGILFVSLLLGCSNSSSDTGNDEEQKSTTTTTTTETTQAPQATLEDPQEPPAETSQGQSQETSQENTEASFTMELPDNAPEGYGALEDKIWDKNNKRFINNSTDEEVLEEAQTHTWAVLYERIAGTSGIIGKYRKEYTTTENGILVEKYIEKWFFEGGMLISVSYNKETPENKHYSYGYYVFYGKSYDTRNLKKNSLNWEDSGFSYRCFVSPKYFFAY